MISLHQVKVTPREQQVWSFLRPVRRQSYNAGEQEKVSMYIFRLLVLTLLISVCIPLAAHAQAVAGPRVKCPPVQREPLRFKSPFLRPVASQQLPILKDGLKVADIIPPPEFRGAQQNNLIMLDANLDLIRVPLRFPCGFYLQTKRSARPKNPPLESEF
jgi:hypothetical protein